MSLKLIVQNYQISHEVTRCWIVSITDGKKYREIFFDIEKVDEFKDTAYNKDYKREKYKERNEK